MSDHVRRALRGARIVGFILLMSQTLLAAAAQDVDRLVAKVIESYGGQARLAAVLRIHGVGTTSSLRTGTRGPSERWFAAPDRLRIDIRYSPTHRESRILAGERAWKDGTPVGNPFHAAMLLQAARLRLPLLLTQRPVLDRGAVGEAGTMLRLVSVDVSDGLRLEVAIDPATGHIRHSRGLLTMGAQTVDFATGYDDFRTVDGVLFAHRERHFAMGMHTGETVLERIEVNPALGSDPFRP